MIQQGLEEIETLQKKVMELNKLLSVTPENDTLTIEYLHMLYACVDKEHIMYTRLQLCDHPEATEFKEHLDSEAKRAGIPKDISVPEYCNLMKDDIKKKLSMMGQDLECDIDDDFFIEF